MALSDNLVSFWNFDESSSNAADSVGSNTLTNNNTATFGAGKLSNAADLERDSSQDFSITDAAQSGLDFTGSFTLAGWFKWESYASGNTYGLFSKYREDNSQKSYRFLKVGGTNALRFDNTTNGSTDVSTPNVAFTPSTGVWHHLAVVFEASTRVEIYVDGSSILTDTSSVSSGIFDGSADFRVGSRNVNGEGGEHYFDGMVDACGAWSRALSDAEIAELYNSGDGIQYPFAGAGPANVKTWNGLATASVSAVSGLTISSVKTWNGLA